MAWDPRGSRALVVDNLSFRWRVHEGAAVVWHQLDMGRLTLPLAPGQVADAALVGAAVRQALARGWSTTDHLTLGQPPPEPAIEQPDADELLAWEARALGAPELLGPPGSTGPWAGFPLGTQPEAALQVVFAPPGEAVLVLTLAVAGEQAWVMALGALAGERLRGRAHADPDGVLDAVVQLQAAPPGPRRPGLRVERLPVRVVARTPARSVVLADEAAERGPARVGALAAWRLGIQAFAQDPLALRLLRRLHGALGPDEDPWAREGRVFRLFGRIGWPQGAGLLAQLGDGPWLLDARDLDWAHDGFTVALRRHRLGHPWPIAVVGERWELAQYRTLAEAEAALRLRT